MTAEVRRAVAAAGEDDSGGAWCGRFPSTDGVGHFHWASVPRGAITGGRHEMKYRWGECLGPDSIPEKSRGQPGHSSLSGEATSAYARVKVVGKGDRRRLGSSLHAMRA
ncbi:hypothetical protein ACFWIA_14945 [Streptomyces sp. NPDC127068]|uniref:hypothetical protein n=1 Tax=Streptomyces sp. NPDC127068 TaxID=3347127 RepID=UPI00364892C2